MEDHPTKGPPRSEKERKARVANGVQSIVDIFDILNHQNVYQDFHHKLGEQDAFDMQRVLHYLSDVVPAIADQEETKEEDGAEPTRMVKAAFFDPVRHVPSNQEVALCRVGLVMFAYYFAVVRHVETGGPKVVIHPVAVKVMDKQQLINQEENTAREMKVLERLRAGGFLVKRPKARAITDPVPLEHVSFHFPQSSHMVDSVNEYLITDYAANKNLIQYVHKRLREYTSEITVLLLDKGIIDDGTLTQRAVQRLWLEEARHIFVGLANAVAYMHHKDVCHLDLSPDNVGIDAQNNPILLDFGSGEVLTDGVAGRDRIIRCKQHYTALEVLVHNRSEDKSRGVDGKAADMYSLGVILYWLIFIHNAWEPQRGRRIVDPLKNDSRWLICLVHHVRSRTHEGFEQTCAICRSGISLDTERDIFQSLLSGHPSERFSARQLVTSDRQEQFRLRDGFLQRCESVVEELVSGPNETMD
ncbi:hypothetical protein Poli38472_008700 [Pythium oligandrum]|uniref:non-specific serine/threonine protein kinase n=1 Tax=Pythium oligandrum TaxID=41045 RepID=A0A8K1C4N1_PYTOL|nr:hypothetical protein Poli38472_008700 [Pythium oligandrum]|eukprot:TMW56052.1 hypothetical protein Poli38472_008700 [Pythium oligandrum]